MTASLKHTPCGAVDVFVAVSAPRRAVDVRVPTSHDVRPRAYAGAGNPVPAWVLPAIVVVGVALRLWRSTTNGLTFDESYTAIVSRRPLGSLLDYLRHTDLHPPLDYILRMPLGHAGASDFALRLPSVVFSSAALALFAWWMRKRGWVGVIATVLVAVSTFQLIYGGEARMYALLQLVGVAAAVIGERWLRTPRPWHAWAISGLVLVAVFDHVQGFLLAAGLLALAGARRDREAWRWRVGLCAAGALWALVWGPSFLEQRNLRWSSWMPRTTVGGIADTVSRQLVFAEGVAPIVFVAVLLGGVCLVRSDRLLGRLWIACGVVPFALASVIGLFEGFLFDRTLSIAAWAPPLAVAWLLGEIVRRWRLIGVAAAVCVVLLALVDSSTFLAVKRWDYDLSVARLQRVAEPGDVIAVQPQLYGALVDWRIGVRGDQPTQHTRVAAIPGSFALRVGNGAESGRVWLLAPAGNRTDFPGYTRCAPRWTDDVTEIVCLRAE